MNAGLSWGLWPVWRVESPLSIAFPHQSPGSKALNWRLGVVGVAMSGFLPSRMCSRTFSVGRDMYCSQLARTFFWSRIQLNARGSSGHGEEITFSRHPCGARADGQTLFVARKNAMVLVRRSASPYAPGGRPAKPCRRKPPCIAAWLRRDVERRAPSDCQSGGRRGGRAAAMMCGDVKIFAQ